LPEISARTFAWLGKHGSFSSNRFTAGKLFFAIAFRSSASKAKKKTKKLNEHGTPNHTAIDHSFLNYRHGEGNFPSRTN